MSPDDLNETPQQREQELDDYIAFLERTAQEIEWDPQNAHALPEEDNVEPEDEEDNPLPDDPDPTPNDED